MKKILFLTLLITEFAFSQSYAPLPGEAGSTAIHKDSSIIVSWATGVSVQRGPMDIAQPGNGFASFGVDSDAVGVANGNVVSFGDGGQAIITFGAPITNGTGFDFAIFENGFADNYIELGFVEVSSDGINFFRFPSVSEAPTSPQYWNGSFSDCRFFNNLAGKYRANYGTPFDLEELSGEVGLNVNAITHVKIIDVVGFVDPTYGTQDSQGNYINDPYPTAFPSCGFDLDAVAVIHEGTQNFNENSISKLNIYPNPSNGVFKVNSSQSGKYSIFSATGQRIFSTEFSNDFAVDLSDFPKGMYILQVDNGTQIITERLNKI